MDASSPIDDGTRRLVVVSNRLPVALERDEDGAWESKPAAGGLVTALLPVLESRGGVWVGWPGMPAKERAGLKAHLRRATARARYEFAPVALTEKEVDGFYHGFSNEILWPLFHDLFATCVFDPEYWHSYVAVNRKFAREVAAVAEADDFIWVQDYHLMNVAGELRELGSRHEIGFFLHIPFPSPDIFTKLPWRRDLLRGLLAFDRLGFQTRRDRDNFLYCLRSLLEDVVIEEGEPLARVMARGGPRADLAGREVRVGAFPISIDYDRFATRAESDKVRQRADYLRKEAKNRCMILGVDRLDYSKGLRYKLAAFENALSRHRTLRKRVTFVQHVVPSRENVPEYQRLRLEVERKVGEINGRFSAPGWVPIHYFYHTLEPDDLAAYYRAADIGLITPLKDGMNLVAKEYCACRVDDDGVLILSEFAGAADELATGALIVNPFDVQAVADRIHRAFNMARSEQQTRMRRLRRVVRGYDVYRWVRSYLDPEAYCEPPARRLLRREEPARTASAQAEARLSGEEDQTARRPPAATGSTKTPA